MAEGRSWTAWELLDADWVKNKYPGPLGYSSTNYMLLGFIVSHFGDGLAPEETDQAYYLPSHLKSQLHFGNNGQTVSEWSDVKFYDLTADAGTGQIRHMDWSDKPGIFLGFGASDLAASVPAVADLVYAIYGAQTVTKQVDEMLTFHHEPLYGYTYGLATMSAGYPGFPIYGHGGDTYGAESEAHYSPLLKSSVVVASNVEIPDAEQTAYVRCMAWFALLEINDPCETCRGDYPIRETCRGALHGTSGLYRELNLRKSTD